MYMPAEVEMMIGMLSPAHPDQPAGTWDLLRKTVDEGCKNIDPGFTPVAYSRGVASAEVRNLLRVARVLSSVRVTSQMEVIRANKLPKPSSIRF